LSQLCCKSFPDLDLNCSAADCPVRDSSGPGGSSAGRRDWTGKTRVAFKLAYLGGRYHGFQRQPNILTVESVVIDALKSLNLNPEGFCYSGRTDRGVSALGQVITFFVDEDKASLAVPRVINSKLPWDIWTWAHTPVPDNFSARYGALWREYQYVLYRPGLDLDSMQKAAKLLVGTHNFRNLSTEKRKDTTRTLMSLDVEEQSDLVVITARSDGFLWNMVRKIVTVLETVGSGEKDVNWALDLLDIKQNQGVSAAPPEGLVLKAVGYPGLEWTLDTYSKKMAQERLFREWRRQISLAKVAEEICRSML